ncbi:MAG: Cof-type HAD-IIB family hydrolase [Treponema sp.]|jgi:Cof subfamily protein (haloacid dehalogenase superfamily)|nr:Cof-type HAD-IIB family hydrolase [Treponema sp.]
MKAGKIRLLALDLDDTLLRSDLSISFRTRWAVRRAAAAGITIVLASGRSPAAMARFSRALRLHRKGGYLICNNGSLVIESRTGRVLYEARIETKSALAAFDLAAAEGFPVQIYEDDVLYVSRANEYADYDQRLTGLRQVVPADFRGMVERGCYKLLIPGDPMLLAPLQSLLSAYLGDDVTLFTSKPYYLEILPKDCNKGASLERIAGLLGIGREAAAAVGDSMNDEAMLRWAGLGIAMQNADERIKQIAAYVTRSPNDDDGVAEAVERVLAEGRGTLSFQ